MKEQAARDSQGLKAGRTRNVRRGRRCRRCPFCAPSGACLDTTIRSGGCGDWVFYLLRGKQFRHLWVKPHDPRTPSQLHWRARLSAASRKYSEALTDEQQNACIAAGARRRSRRRLAQSGPLTGQQWWVRSQCAEKAEGRMQNAETTAKGLQTQGILRPTWEPHRSISVVPPGHYCRNTGRAGKKEGRRKNEECGRQKATDAMAVRQGQRISRSTSPHYRSATWAMRRQVACNSGTLPAMRGFRPRRCAGGDRAGGVHPAWRWRQRAVGRERGPPAQDAVPRHPLPLRGQPPHARAGQTRPAPISRLLRRRRPGSQPVQRRHHRQLRAVGVKLTRTTRCYWAMIQ